MHPFEFRFRHPDEIRERFSVFLGYPASDPLSHGINLNIKEVR